MSNSITDAENEPKGKEECRLCGKTTQLKRSHVIPKFVTQWIKDSSATGYLRTNQNPNRRAQDGVKRKWLCSVCEQVLSPVEGEFRKHVFGPIAERHAVEFSYGPWLQKFCVSISWRVLHYFLDKDAFADYPVNHRALLDDAEYAWRGYLLDAARGIQQFPQHIWIVPSVRSQDLNVANNINVHISRQINIDVVKGEQRIMTYAKLPHLIIIGVIHDEAPGDWGGTEVLPEGGIMTSSGQQVPRPLFNFINEKAKHANESAKSMSEKQRARVSQDFMTDPSRTLTSGTVRALGLDAGIREDMTDANEGESGIGLVANPDKGELELFLFVDGKLAHHLALDREQAQGMRNSIDDFLSRSSEA